MEYIAVVRESLVSPQLFDVTISAGNIFDVQNAENTGNIVYALYMRGRTKVKLSTLIAYMRWQFPPRMQVRGETKYGQFMGIEANLDWIIAFIHTEFNWHLGDKSSVKNMPNYVIEQNNRLNAIKKNNRNAHNKKPNMSTSTPTRVTAIINSDNKWRNHSM